MTSSSSCHIIEGEDCQLKAVPSTKSAHFFLHQVLSEHAMHAWMYVPHCEKLMLEPRGRAGLALQTVLPERGRQIPYDSISLWDIKGGTNELIDKAEAGSEALTMVRAHGQSTDRGIKGEGQREGVGKERTRSLGLAHANCYMKDG